MKTFFCVDIGKKIVKIIKSFLKINCKLSKIDKKLLDYTSQNDFWQKWSKQKDLPKSTTTLGPFIEKLILKMPIKLFHTVSEKSKSDIKKIAAIGVRVSKWIAYHGFSLNINNSIEPFGALSTIAS